MTMRGEVKLQGLDGVLSLLHSLPPEVVSKSGGPVKGSLRAGARVIQREAALNVANRVGTLDADDEARTTGLLQRSVISSRGKAPASGKGERYLVRVKRQTYQRKGKPVTTLKTAHLLEYGSSQQKAEPWLRPAFAAKAVEAIRTIEAQLLSGIDRVVRKLTRGKGGLG